MPLLLLVPLPIVPPTAVLRGSDEAASDAPYAFRGRFVMKAHAVQQVPDETRSGPGTVAELCGWHSNG